MREDRAQPGEFYSSYEQRKTEPPDRECEICGVKLSVYNDTLRCSVHKHSNILHARKKKKRREV